MWEKLKKLHPFWWFAIFFVAINVLWLGPTFVAGGGLDAGEPAPAFTLPRVDGEETISLDSLSGHTSVLVFWATWCDSCVAEIPVLEAIQRERGDDVKILGMNLEPESRPMVARFVSSHAVPYPNVSVDRNTAAAYKVKILPTIYVIDGAGNVCKGFRGRVGQGRLSRAIDGCSE